MQLKLRLPAFSLICVHFSFWFCNLQPLTKCWYIIYIIYTLTVWPGILARSKSHFWDHVLCWLTRRYCWSVWQGTPFLVSLLVIQRPVLLPRPDMASLGFLLLLLLLTCDHNCFNYKVHKLHKVHNIKYTNCETKDISHYAEISFIPHKNKSLCLLLLDYWY